MRIRPKQFVAARDFTIGTQAFRQGDPIPHGLTLQRLLRHGDKFAVKTSTSVEQPADPPEGEAIPAESTKED